MQKVIIITGPTASGKSTLALEYAKKNEKSIIINADASAVYAGFPILTAREKTNFEEHLFEIEKIENNFSVGKWLEMVEEILKNNPEKTKIIVGGTCMYIYLLINGLIEMPNILPEYRLEAVNKMQEEGGYEEMLKEVLKHEANPKVDAQRLINNYALILQTGKSFNSFQGGEKKMFLKQGEYNLIKLMPEREALYSKCNLRFEAMLQMGAIEEVQKQMEVYGRNYDFKKIIGANEIKEYLLGNISYSTMQEKAMQKTRNLATSQITWLKNKL